MHRNEDIKLKRYSISAQKEESNAQKEKYPTQDNKLKCLLALLENEEDVRIGKSCLINQRTLMRELKLLIERMDLMPFKTSIWTKRKDHLLHLQSMLLNNHYSHWLFKDIVAESLNSCQKTTPQLFSSPQHIYLSEGMNELVERFGEVKLFPILFTRRIEPKLFNKKHEIDTEAVLYLDQVAENIRGVSQAILKPKCFPFYRLEKEVDTINREKVFMEKVRARNEKLTAILVAEEAEKLKIFCELLDPILLKMNLQDPDLYKQILAWDVTSYCKNIMGESYSLDNPVLRKCAPIQALMLDRLPFLRAIQAENLDISFLESLRKLRGPAALPVVQRPPLPPRK